MSRSSSCRGRECDFCWKPGSAGEADVTLRPPPPQPTTTTTTTTTTSVGGAVVISGCVLVVGVSGEVVLDKSRTLCPTKPRTRSSEHRTDCRLTPRTNLTVPGQRPSSSRASRACCIRSRARSIARTSSSRSASGGWYGRTSSPGPACAIPRTARTASTTPP